MFNFSNKYAPDSWCFRERACQFHSEYYLSVADSVYLGQTYVYILWPKDLDSHFLPPLPDFPQSKTLPGHCVDDRWAGGYRHLQESHVRERQTQLVNVESSL